MSGIFGCPCSFEIQLFTGLLKGGTDQQAPIICVDVFMKPMCTNGFQVWDCSEVSSESI